MKFLEYFIDLFVSSFLFGLIVYNSYCLYVWMLNDLFGMHVYWNDYHCAAIAIALGLTAMVIYDMDILHHTARRMV